MNITRRDRDRFLSDSDEELAAACTLDFFKSTGRGGQKRNKTSSAVRLTHRPTGLSVTDCSERSQHRNRAAALAKLRLLIAREVRCHPAEAPEPVACGLSNPRYPLWCARLLVCLAERQWDLECTAGLLGCSRSQLTKLLARDGALLEKVNAERLAAGLGFLHG